MGILINSEGLPNRRNKPYKIKLTYYFLAKKQNDCLKLFMAIVIPVILCGGSGTRLWPLSRAGFPKQFLVLFADASRSWLYLSRNYCFGQYANVDFKADSSQICFPFLKIDLRNSCGSVI